MSVAIVMAAIIAIYAAISFYVRKSHEFLEASDAPWDRLYAAAEKVIADPTMPQRCAAFAAAAVMCAGCGCLTRQLLWDQFRRSIGLTKPKDRNGTKDMTAEQRELFGVVVLNAIYYDSLRAPFSGFLLRRLVFPWLKAASEGQVPARKGPVTQMAKSSLSAISHRREMQKILVGA